MHLSSLKLYQFRNLENQSVRFNRALNLIAGRNGQGKTNLVEAIHLLSHGQSFRTSDPSDLVAWNNSEASIFSEIISEAGSLQHSYELGLAIRQGKREAFLNGNRLGSMAQFLGRCVCVTFTPTDLSLVKGGPQFRRRFIDRHIIDCRPLLAAHFLNYHRALRHKAKLLKDPQVDARELDVWDELMANETLQIVSARREFISRLTVRAAMTLASFGPTDGPLALELKSCLDETPTTVAPILEKLRDIRGREIKQRACLFGPHREDVLISLGGNEARPFASQGQARSVVLALKLALVGLIEEERAEAPILVLDDFDSELDAARKQRLFEEIFLGDKQVFVTGTSVPELPSGKTVEKSLFEVSSGRIQELL